MNTLYPSARQRFLTKKIHWLQDSFAAALVAPDYVYDASHEVLTAIQPVWIKATAPITARTAVDGWANGACKFLDAPPIANAVVIFKDTGNSAQSALIAYYDLGFGLPTTEDGSFNFIATGLGYFRL